MSKKFYIQVRGKRQGPFTVERLRQMAKRGRFGRQHRISTDGRSWKSAEEFPELFAAEGERKMRQSGAAGMGAEAAIPADPTAVAPAAPASQGWFYSHGGQQLGPVSMEVLRHAKSTGTLKADDLVWTHGMTEWKRADKALPGLFSAQAEAAAPGPGGGAAAVGPEGAPVEYHGQMSNLALYSLVLGFIPLIGSIAAIICGHKALGDIDSSDGEMEGRNLALGGLILGYGGLALLLLGGLYYMSSSAFEPGAGGWQPQMKQPGVNQPANGQPGQARPGFSQPANQAPQESARRQ